MLHPPIDPDKALRDAIYNGNIVFVAGTGVSLSATFDKSNKASHPQASWAGLLKHGVDEAERMGRLAGKKATLYRSMLDVDPTTQNLISAATAVTEAFGGVTSGIFKDWLAATIGTVRPINRDIIDALHALREADNLLATTNYDDVLLDHPSPLVPITWSDGDGIIGAQRNRELDKIIYLHGYWKRPDTVILDGRSYDQIARHEDYRADLAAFWRTTTWVYVGCGISGLNDPDFGLLLERHGERARDAQHWDFCLVPKNDRAAFQKHFDDLKLNIVAVSYGDNHSALPAFLRTLLPAPVSYVSAPVVAALAPSPCTIPKSPAFHAVPDYLGSHKFVGRAAELQVLSDWAAPADPTNLLLFEAIGGNGKSMLTWEWTTNPRHALTARPADRPWAGRFWYSFYEGGASMEDFCRQTLAYMTGRPLEEFAKKKTAELKDDLLAQLHAKPWLLILDGLERILVAYHRIDAAEVPDEEANIPTDKIADRNPCDAIRDEDNDLLRALAAAAPSKLLVSSRLTPRVLLNPSGQTIPGARRINLPGLRPPDAEALLRSCGIEGKSDAIQSYLAANCDNHPLVIGILGGLIANYLPARGDFDAWSAAPEGGAALDLASLDLIQRRNHILEAAIQKLPDASRQLLSTLALLTDSVDYETLNAFNPHLPPEPEVVEMPATPEKRGIHRVDGKWMRWEQMSDEQKAGPQNQYEAALASWQDYEKAVQARLTSAEYRESSNKLTATVLDLEQRGLLQYDRATRRHDMHPVVRGVTIGGLRAEAKQLYGQRVVDHFSAQSHDPYEQADSLEDIRGGMHIVRTLLKIGRYQQALEAFNAGLSITMQRRLEANAEILSLIKPFFSDGWGTLSAHLSKRDAFGIAVLANHMLREIGQIDEAIEAGVAIMFEAIEEQDHIALVDILVSIATAYSLKNRLQKEEQCRIFALGIASKRRKKSVKLGLSHQLSKMGRLKNSSDFFATGELNFEALARRHNAYYLFWNGKLNEQNLTEAETFASRAKARHTLRDLVKLRSLWKLEQKKWSLAATSFAESLRMARESGIPDTASETGLALAKYHLGQLVNPREEAYRLSQLRNPAHRLLAQLWLSLGEPAQAKQHALAAYLWAWADGEPYVWRYELTQTIELLRQMNVPIPNLPPYDPAKDQKLPWEDEVRAAIEKLREKMKANKGKTD